MFMTYIAVYGGGAYVIEDQVATGYPLLTFIGLIMMPWLVGFPVYGPSLVCDIILSLLSLLPLIERS